ncbi:nuclear transport factor 2 family protein, partial [Planctomycetota bacterium]
MRNRMVCLIILLSLTSTPVLAQTPDELIAIRGIYAQAIEDNNIDGILASFTDDGVHDMTVGPPVYISDGSMRAFWEDQFASSPAWHTEAGRVISDGNVVVVEHKAFGTNVVVAETDKSWVWPHIDIFDFEGNKIKHLMSYGDYASALVQFGLAPAPDMPDLVPSIVVPDPESTGLSPMEANAEHIRRWNSHDAASVATMYHGDLTMFPGPLGMVLDRAAMTAMNEMYFVAFPNVAMEVVRAIDLGDGWVVTELIARATHQQEFMGIPAQGYPTEIRVSWLMRHNADGVVVEGSFYYDNLTLINQMTTAPYPLDGIWISTIP